MDFYSLKQRKTVKVPEKDITYRTLKNGIKQAVATFKGEKLYKFVKK